MLLRISIENNHKNLILGAWGCGVFGNDPNDVARYFKEVIEQKYSTAFEKVFFAIYSRDERILKPFIEHFGE